VLAVLIVLSRLGIDTAPLIAGAGVFGLAVSFGAQSLVRDIISGVFYMWDDAFRVGEYIDTGRLKGTVETLGIRSVKLRHQNGPLHTIPYGQLGAVTNLSRDFATIKFNLRFDPHTDIELVRKYYKNYCEEIGISQDQLIDLGLSNPGRGNQPFSLTVLVGLRFMGALLSSALIIIPAATARRLTGRMAPFVALASAASVFSVATGFLVGTLLFKTSTVGPTIVIVSALLFAVSLLTKR